MALYSAIAVQTVNSGGSPVYTETIFDDETGWIQHRDGMSTFLLSGYNQPNVGCPCCNKNDTAVYLVDVGVNLAIPTGGTVGQIAIALAIDGTPIPYSEMDVTPAAVEEYFHVSNAIVVPIFNNCCQTLTVQVLSDEPVLMKNLVTRIVTPGSQQVW